MSMQHERRIVKIEADWILPVSSPPFKDGAVVIEGDTIKAVGKKEDISGFPYDEAIDCSGKILMPGFINAHAHLELTGFKGKIKKGLSFPDWAREVVSIRKGINEKEITSAIENGLDELISSGVTAIGDFSQTGVTARMLDKKGLRGTVFLEFGRSFNPEQKDEKLRQLNEVAAALNPLNQVQGQGSLRESDINVTQAECCGYPNPNNVRFGIAPHAPYSVSAELLKESYHFAREKDFPVAMHISEMPEEIEFIKAGSGAMRDLLIDFGVWNDKWVPPQSTPVKYLDNLKILKGTTGIHLNIVNSEDIRILKENGMSVVYCPGSNKWFGRNWKYPLKDFLNNGINVAIGTDSLSSNEQLNMFYEMRIVKENFPEIDNNTILRMATINGAKAIGFEGEIGEIAAGRKADIIGINTDYSLINNPDDFIITRAEKVSFSMVNGESILQPHHLCIDNIRHRADLR